MDVIELMDWIFGRELNNKFPVNINYMSDKLWKQVTVIFVENFLRVEVLNSQKTQVFHVGETLAGSYENINTDWLHKIVNTFTK